MNIYDVFLSYRRSDGAELAQKIFDYLTAKGLRVFFDTEKMIDGHYFTTQIVDNLRQAPNYILVATQDVFNFRDGEDWVRKEIALALTEYEADSINRTINVIAPSGVVFPEQSALPESVRNITVPNRINLLGSEPTDEEYLRLLKAVSGVNRRNLWNAGHRWLENSKKEGARFAALRIDETILPKAKKRAKKQPEHGEMPIRVYQKEKSEDGYEHRTDEQQLLDALGSTQGHLYLIGEGGIGKTTSLIRIMNEAYSDRQYSENAQIPLFIELSRAPDTYGRLYEGGVSTFIRRAIYQQLRTDRSVKQVSAQASGQIDNVFSIAPEVAVVPINDLLNTESSAPEYLLLLDGLNETSRTEIGEVGRSVVQMIMQEINWIIENCPNVRVMLTSRTDETAMSNKKITRLYLTGVDNDTIREYLESCKLSSKRIDAVFENECLRETLRIPLFLTMYASLKGVDEVTSRGGIFRMFFSERRENLDVYTTQSRIASVDADIASAASKHNAARIDAKMQNFILDFLLPEIAWNMERNDLFYMDIEDIANIVERVLVDESLTAVCGRYGKKLFTKYRNGADSAMHTLRVAKSMVKKLGGDFEEIAEAVVNCCTLQLGIMQESNGQHGFMHHHIRDYFAAVREVNSLRLAVYAFEQGKDDVARECLVSMKETPIHLEVRRFIGEYLGEDKNAPILVGDKWKYNVPVEKCDRNLIKRALDIFRGRFDGKDGYAVFCFVDVLKNVRRDLSGADLSKLDLRMCVLNGINLGRVECTSIFCGALIHRDNLFPSGHTDYVYNAFFSKDGKRIFTVAYDNTINIWNADTFAIEQTISGPLGRAHNISISPDGKYIVSTSEDSYDSTQSQHKDVSVWDASSLALIATLRGHSDFVHSVSFSPDNEKIITASADGTAKIWSVCTNELIVTFQCEDGLCSFAQYTPNGEYIVVSSERNTEIFSSKDYKSVATIPVGARYPLALSISSDSKFLVAEVNGNILTDTGIKLEPYEVGIVLISLETNKVISVIKNTVKSTELTQVISIDFSPDGSRVVIITREGDTTIWDIQSESVVVILDSDIFSTCARYSNDGLYIVVGKNDGSVEVWDANSFFLVKRIASQTNRVISVSYSHDNSSFVTTSNEYAVKIWDARRNVLRSISGILPDAASNAVFSPDGKQIAVAFQYGGVSVYDSSEYSLLSKLPIRINSRHRKEMKIARSDFLVNGSSPKSEMQYSNDGAWLLTGSTTYKGTIDLWDTEKYELIFSSPGDRFVTFTPDCRYIVAPYKTYWDTKTRTELGFHYNESDITSAEYSKDGKYIVTGQESSRIRIWDTETMKTVAMLCGHTDAITHAVFSPNNKHIASAAEDGSVIIWDVKSLREVCSLDLPVNDLESNSADVDYVTCLLYNTDGSHLVALSESGNVFVLDTSDYSVIKVLSRSAYDIYYSHNGKQLIILTDAHTIEFYDAHQFDRLSVFSCDSEYVNRYILGSGDSHIILVSHDESAEVWDACSAQIIKTIPSFYHPICYAYSKDKARMVLVYDDCCEEHIALWDVNNDIVLADLSIRNNPELEEIVDYESVIDVTFSPDDKQIMLSYPSIICVLDSSTLNIIHCLQNKSNDDIDKNGSMFFSDIVRYSPTNALVACSKEESIVLRDAETDYPITSLRGHTKSIINMSFSYDGKYLASASRDKTAIIWDIRASSLVATLTGHTDCVNDVAFSSDGSRIITVSDDGTIKIWSTDNYECLYTIPNISELRPIGCDLRNLHPDSHFSDEDKEILRRYGAIID